MEMTFQELCISDPHRRSGAINKPWAVLVQTRTGKVWRFYRATNYAQAENKAFGSDDCMEALRIVPIYEEQYARGIAAQRKQSAYNRRKARSSWAGN